MKPLALLSGLALSGCSVFGIRTVEEPAFTVRDHLGAVEIRAYAPRIAAETSVAGGEIEARGTGFRRLAGYIFGGNRQRSNIEMTAPVAQSGGGPSEGGRDIAMTAPVASARAEDGTWRIRFFMPASFSMSTLPEPNDPAVRLVAVPEETYAVLRFSGSTSPVTVAARQAELVALLVGGSWKPSASPVAWFYDPPWTLPPFRRNEVAVAVAAAPG